LFGSGRHNALGGLCKVSRFGLGRRDVADRLEQATVVEPVDPFEGCELDGLAGSPRPPPVDDLGLVETVDGLGQSVVVAVADAADGRLVASLGQVLRVADRAGSRETYCTPRSL